MRAITIEHTGTKTGRLVPFSGYPRPSPKAGEMLIRIAYAGLNRADILQRKGLYPPPEGASPLPGLEVSGEVVALGENVTQWQVGDNVCALLAGGGYAEYATVAASHALPVPDNYSLKEAAALPEALFTCWLALYEKGGLSAHERLLVHGGASGIGMMAIALARHLGAVPYTTASTQEKCAAALAQGAQLAVSYQEQDFVTAFETALGKNPFHMVLDFIGGDYVEKNLRLLREEGRMVSLAFLKGARVEQLNLAPMLLKRLTWVGVTLRAQPDKVKSSIATALGRILCDKTAASALKPHVFAEFPLEDAEKAHHMMEQNLNIGKIVLKV